MKTPLSKQQRIIDFIRRFLAERSYPPTIRDIVSGCGISSTSVVDYNLNKLEKDGYIRRHREVSRGIELLAQFPLLEHQRRVPIVGQIAAGEPIPVPTPDTWNTIASSETLEITEDLTRGKEAIYALKVKGSSMVDALINDGDIVLVKHQQHADNGDMVAARLREENETTLKRFYLEGDRVRLQPANPAMAAIFAPARDVEVQGKVIMVIRQLD